MKVREERGGGVSIFYDFLLHKKRIFQQFSKIDRKQQIKK